MESPWMHWITSHKDFLGLLIGAVGVPLLFVQISQGARQERKRLRRRRQAAIATLPLTLSALSQYAEGMMQALGPLQRWLRTGQQGADPRFNARDVPADAILAVERMIEAEP